MEAFLRKLTYALAGAFLILPNASWSDEHPKAKPITFSAEQCTGISYGSFILHSNKGPNEIVLFEFSSDRLTQFKFSGNSKELETKLVIEGFRFMPKTIEVPDYGALSYSTEAYRAIVRVTQDETVTPSVSARGCYRFW